MADDVAGPLGGSCDAGELAGDEHPATITAAIAIPPTPLSNLWFMVRPSVERICRCYGEVVTQGSKNSQVILGAVTAPAAPVECR